MTAGSPDHGDHVREFLKLEYTALRGELIKRVEFKQRLLGITVVSAGAVLALNLTWDQFARILLAFPILVMCLALGWMHHDLRLQKLATYIRWKIEPVFHPRSNAGADSVGYETWLDEDRERPGDRIGGMSAIAVFLITQVLVFIAGLASAGPKIGKVSAEALAFFLGFSAIYMATMFLMVYRRLPNWLSGH